MLVSQYVGSDTFENLEETMHVQVGDLSQDSTFDLFEFLSKFFFQNLSFQTRGAAYLRVRLIRRCLRYLEKLISAHAQAIMS